MTFHSAPVRTVAALAIAATMTCVGAFGQAAQTADIQAFTHEATLPLGQIGFSGTLAVPPNVVQSIQGGALEIRQSVTYIPATRLLRVRHFLVAPQSPNPTPDTAQFTLVDDYLVNVTSIQRYAAPMSIVFMGKVEQVSISSPFGQIGNNAVIYSFGYTPPTAPATTTALTNVTLVQPGKLTTYIQTSTGTLTFATTPGGPGPTTGPKADAGMDITTAQSEIALDGSKSSHSENDTLTYSWRVVSGSAIILNGASARPSVQLSGNFGSYVFELTVTDTKGAKSVDTVTVQYSGRF